MFCAGGLPRGVVSARCSVPFAQYVAANRSS